MSNKINYNIIGYFTHNSNDIRGLEVYENLIQNNTLDPAYEIYLKLSWLRIAKLSSLSTSYVVKKWYYDFIYDQNDNFKEISLINDKKNEYADNAISYIEDKIGEIYVSDNFQTLNLNENDFSNSDIILLKEFNELKGMTIENFLNDIKLDDSYKIHYFKSQNINILKDINDKINWKYWNMHFGENLISLNEDVLETSIGLLEKIKFLKLTKKDNNINLNEQNENTIYDLLENEIKITNLRYIKEHDLFENTGSYFEPNTIKKYELKVTGTEIKSEVEVRYEGNITGSFSYDEQCSIMLNLEEEECSNFMKDLNSNSSNISKKYFENEKIFEIFDMRILYNNFKFCLNFIEMMLDKLEFKIYEKNIYLFTIPYGNAVRTEIYSERFHKKKIKYYENFDMWNSHQTLFNDLSKLDNFKKFINKCIEFINSTLCFLNPDIINNDEVNILSKIRNLKDADVFYKNLSKNFNGNKLKENILNSFKLNLSLNNLNLIGIISSMNDKNSNDLLAVINSFLNFNLQKPNQQVH